MSSSDLFDDAEDLDDDLLMMEQAEEKFSDRQVPRKTPEEIHADLEAMGMNEEVEIPRYLERMLLDYTIRFLIDRPDDMLDHAAEYFTRKEKEMIARAQAKLRESVDEGVIAERASRRGTMGAETYEQDEIEEILTFPKTKAERQRISERLKDMSLFKALTPEGQEAVVDAMEKKVVKKGDKIVRQGDEGDFFYVVDEGVYDVYVDDEEMPNRYVMTYDNSGSFGELALLHNQPRAATVRAASDGVLWSVGRVAFRRLISHNYNEKRKRYMRLMDAVPELRPLSYYEKLKVCEALSEKVVRQGDVVFEEGDDADGMYFIEEGKIKVSRNKGGQEETLAYVVQGGFFGELALVEQKPRAATCSAKVDSKLAFLDVMAFERLLGPCSDVLAKHIATYDDPPNLQMLRRMSAMEDTISEAQQDGSEVPSGASTEAEPEDGARRDLGPEDSSTNKSTGASIGAQEGEKQRKASVGPTGAKDPNGEAQGKRKSLAADDPSARKTSLTRKPSAQPSQKVATSSRKKSEASAAPKSSSLQSKEVLKQNSKSKDVLSKGQRSDPTPAARKKSSAAGTAPRASSAGIGTTKPSGAQLSVANFLKSAVSSTKAVKPSSSKPSASANGSTSSLPKSPSKAAQGP